MKKSVTTIVILQLLWIVVSAQTHYGTSAGTLGALHSYFGTFAGNAAVSSSYENSFFGHSSGKFTTTGHGNTAVGVSSLRENTTGYWNVGIGSQALRLNTTGYGNVAIGRWALYNNTVGHHNVAIGLNALLNNVEVQFNVAVGAFAMENNSTGLNNVATGYSALRYLTTGRYNTATGTSALKENTAGQGNSAYGMHSLYTAQGHYNAAFGYHSGFTNDEPNDFTNSCFFGAVAGTTELPGATNINVFGFNAIGTASNQVRIGNTAVTSIGGQVAWSNLSDGRFKRDLRNDVAGMDFIRQLKPVSYIVDKDALNNFLGIPDSLRMSTSETEGNARQVGFVAQDVDAIIKKSGFVFSGIESPKNENDPYAIRYGEFVVPIVKAMQELMAEVDQLKQQLKQYTEQSSAAEKRTTTASLKQNNPNPFSSDTEIRMEIPDGSRQADIIVYNLEGKQLKNIPVSGRGDTAVKIAGNNLSAGMYLYTLIIDGEIIDTKRLLLR